MQERNRGAIAVERADKFIRPVPREPEASKVREDARRHFEGVPEPMRGSAFALHMDLLNAIARRVEIVEDAGAAGRLGTSSVAAIPSGQ